MRLFIAVDGGNSKTDVVVGDVTGRVCAYVRGPGSSPHNLGLPGARRVLDELVGRALSAAGVGDVELASIYLAGADLPVEVERLTAELGTLRWAARTAVDNDTFALLRTGTAARDAVAVVCGAGTNCVGRRADGRTARFPALGQLTGDWGGGHHIAQLALYHAARGEDGRGPDTALIRAVAEHFGTSTVEDVSIALHLGDVTLDRMYQLSKVLFEVAAAGDPVARRVVQRQADEVVAFARVAASRLDLLSEPHAVVLGGGVLSARHPLLHDAVVEGILAIAPKAAIGIATGPPVVGAALLAMEALLGGPAPAACEEAMRVALRAAPIELPLH